MSNVTRRHFIQMSAGLALLPLLANAAKSNLKPVSSESYLNGGLKGFVIGRVTNNIGVEFFDALAATGANVGRIFLIFQKCNGCMQYRLPYNDIVALKHHLGAARARNIKLVIVGEFPGTETQEFWSNTSLQASFVDNWRQISRKLGNNSAIAGLDLLNEPNPPWPSYKIADTHIIWRSLAEQTINAIRSENVTLPIIYEGVAGGSTLGLRDFVPFKDNNIVYSIHFYTPHNITHQHVNPTWATTIPYPAGVEWGLGKWDEIGVRAWNISALEYELRDTINFQRRYNVPIYVGEFSCVRWAPNNSRERYIADCLSIFKKYGWSWTYHEFRGWAGWDAEMASEDPNVSKRSLDAPVIKMLRIEMLTNKD